MHRDAQGSSSSDGGFSKNPEPASKLLVPDLLLETSQPEFITALIFPEKYFHTIQEVKFGSLQASPTYIHIAGNSLLPPNLTILESPGQPQLSDLEVIFAFFFLFFFLFISACLLQLKREALKCQPRQLQAGVHRHAWLGAFVRPWDLHLLHPLVLQAHPIPWTFANLKPA